MALKTPISLLQEIMVKQNQPLPAYSFDSIGNLLEPKFSCAVMTTSTTAIGIARNKKEAKQIAAENALINLGYKTSSERSFSNMTNSIEKGTRETPETLPDGYTSGQNYIGILHEYASGKGLPYPQYEEPLFPENGKFKLICKFHGIETVGYARNKKEAKQIASYEMFHYLHSIKPVRLEATPLNKVTLQWDDKDAKVLEKFEDISISAEGAERTPLNVEPNGDIEKKLYTIEEAKDELSKRDVEYEIDEVQKNPYIVVVRLKNSHNMTLFGNGKGKEEACTMALNNALDVLRGGCALISL